MAAKTTKRKAAARQQKTPPAPPAVFEVGSEEWKEDVRKARARILGGRDARPESEQSLERVAELVEQHDEAARRGDVKECEKLRDWLTDWSARDTNWTIKETPPGSGFYSMEDCKLAVLMDIRRRLDTILDRLPEKEPRA